MAKSNTWKGDILALLKKVGKEQAVIAQRRDALRLIFADLEDVLTTLDDADDDLDQGIRTIRHAIDRMSEYL